MAEEHTFTYVKGMGPPLTTDQGDGSVSSNVPLVDTNLASGGGGQARGPAVAAGGGGAGGAIGLGAQDQRWTALQSQGANVKGVLNAPPPEAPGPQVTPLPQNPPPGQAVQQPSDQSWQPSPQARAVAQQQADQYAVQDTTTQKTATAHSQGFTANSFQEQGKDQRQGFTADSFANPADHQDEVNKAVEDYKTATELEQAFAYGQINKQVAQDGIAKIQQTYNNAYPAQKTAMEKAEEDAAKPEPAGSETQVSPGGQTVSALLTGATPFVLNKFPINDAQNYLADQVSQHKITNDQYTYAQSELDKARQILLHDPRMSGGTGLGTTQQSGQQMQQAEQELATHLTNAVPEFMKLRQQQAITEVSKLGSNLQAEARTWLPGQGKSWQENISPRIPILKRNPAQVSLALNTAQKTHNDEVNKVTFSDADQSRADEAIRRRGLVPYNRQYMAEKGMAPKPGAATGYQELGEQSLNLAASVLPMPWDAWVAEKLLPSVFKTAAVPFSVGGKGVEWLGKRTLRGVPGVISHVVTGAAGGVAGAVLKDPHQFIEDLHDPDKMVDYLKGAGESIGVGALGGLLLGGTLLGTGRSSRILASILRSASPEIRYGIDPATGKALSSYVPYRAVKNPLIQAGGRAAGSYAESFIKGIPYASPDLKDGDVKQFVSDLNQFGMFGALLRAPQDVRDAFRGGTFDSLNAYRGEKPKSKAPPITPYGNSLDYFNERGVQQMDPSRKASFAWLRYFMTPYGSAYALPDDVYDHIAQGVTGAQHLSSGFTMSDPNKPGGVIAMFKASHFDLAAFHEMIGHVGYKIMSPANRAGFNRLLAQTVNLDELANTYANRANPGTGHVSMSMLPTNAEITPGNPNFDPAKQTWSQAHANLTKERLFEEAGAETIQALWGGQTAEQWTKSPSKLRQFSMYLGDMMEKLGLPTMTPDVKGPLGVDKSAGAAKLLDLYLRDFAQGNILPGAPQKSYFPGGGGGPPWAPVHGPGGGGGGGGPIILGGHTPTPTGAGAGGGAAAGGGTPPIKPANVLKVTGPPAAPTTKTPIITPWSGTPDESVIKGLMKQGFSREQATAFAAKGTVSPVHGQPQRGEIGKPQGQAQRETKIQSTLPTGYTLKRTIDQPNEVQYEISKPLAAGEGVAARFHYIKDPHGVFRPYPVSGINITDPKLRGQGLGQNVIENLLLPELKAIGSTGLGEEGEHWGTSEPAQRMWKRLQAKGATVEDLPQTPENLGAKKAWVLRYPEPEKGPEAVPEPKHPPAADTDEAHRQMEEADAKGTLMGESQAAAEGKEPQTLEQTGEEPPAFMPGKTGDPIKAWRESLTDKERQAVDYWLGGGFGKMRRTQRLGVEPEYAEQLPTGGMRDELTPHWESAIAKAPTYEGTVFRGLGQLHDSDIAKLADQSNVLKTYSDSSASLDPEVAQRYALIKAQQEGRYTPHGHSVVLEVKGQHKLFNPEDWGEKATPENYRDKEVITPKGTSYGIEDFRPDYYGPNQHHVVLQQLPDLPETGGERSSFLSRGEIGFMPGGGGKGQRPIWDPFAMAGRAIAAQRIGQRPVPLAPQTPQRTTAQQGQAGTEEGGFTEKSFPQQERGPEAAGVLPGPEPGIKPEETIQPKVQPKVAQPKVQPKAEGPKVSAPAAPEAKAEQPQKTDTGIQIGETKPGKVKGVVGSEFGEVDNPTRGGYTESGWNKGAWGERLDGEDNHGFALPPSILSHVGYHGQKGYGQEFNSKYEIRAYNPKTGATTTGSLKDLGPGKSTGALIDILWGSRKDLGFDTNFKGAVNFEIVDKNTGKVVYQPTGQEIDEGGGGAIGKGGGGGGGKGGGKEDLLKAAYGAGGAPPGTLTPGWVAPAPGVPRLGAEAPALDTSQPYTGGGGESGGGGGGGYVEAPPAAPTRYSQAPEPMSPAMQMAEFTGSYGGGYGYGGYGGNIPGIQPMEAPGISFMPAGRRRMGGITPEGEEGEPIESTLGEPNVRGFEQLTPHLKQGLEGYKRAQKLHAKLLSPDDTRVKKQADNYFKGEHFIQGDPMHAAALSDVPEHERVALAAGQTAIANKKPMHLTYVSAPPSPQKESPITRRSREVNYDESSPQARMLGQTNGRLAGHSIIPTSIGVALPRKKGDPNNGYIQGISTSVAAHNHYHLNQELAAAGEQTPYPTIDSPKFRNDMRGYIQNLLAGHRGAGHRYQVGTEEYPANPDRNYVPYRLNQREADFMNAIINNQGARHSKDLKELARKGGTLLTEGGETNPLRREIDVRHASLRGATAEEIADSGIKKAAEKRWSEAVMEPTIRTFNTGLIHSLHERPEHIPEEIRPSAPGYEKLTEALGKQLTSEKGRPDVPMAVAFMPGGGAKKPAPLSPEEHAELTSNIRKQFLSGKLRQADYLERLKDVPEPGEELEGPSFMPMAGRKARGFAEAQKEGRTFETPLPGGGQRFEINDQDMQFKPASGKLKFESGFTPRNALEERYHQDRRGAGRMALGNAIQHPELFENYPFLRNTKISMDPTIAHYGHYEQPWLDDYGDPQGDHILLKDPTDKETLAHEIQHAVQIHEDFAGKGSSSKQMFEALTNNEGVRDELAKQWEDDHPERANMSEEELKKDHRMFGGWAQQRLRDMARAMYQMEPGEIEARVAGQRAIRLTPEQREEMKAEVRSRRSMGPGQAAAFRETTPKEDVLQEMQVAAQQGRQAGTLSPVSFMAGGKKAESKAAKAPAPPPEISQETQAKLGARPKDEKQGKLWDQVAARLDTQIPGAIPLEPDLTEEGKFKMEPDGKPKYQKSAYDIANSPLLQKAGKALGQTTNKKTGKLQMAKAPDETEDDLEKLDPEKRLTPYLNPTDRKRVSYLNDISAVDTFADKLHEMYKSIEHLPEVMGGKDWYDEAKTWLEHHFGAHSDLVANLLAATSPGNKVKINYGMAIKAYHQFLRGNFDRHIDLYREAYDVRRKGGEGALMQYVRDKGIQGLNKKTGQKEFANTDERAMLDWIEHHDITPRNEEEKLFGHNSLHVLKVLAHTWEKEAGGPKAPNFAANLNGRSLQATIDMWAARTMRRLGHEGHTDQPWLIQPAGESGVNDTDFGLSQLAFKKAADRIGIKPSSLQAILWFAEQKHWQANGWERGQDAEDRDYRPMLKAYQRAPDITKAHMKAAEKKRAATAALGA